MTVFILVLYSGLLVAGGLMGYFTAGSLVSLVSGLLSGIAVFGASLAVMRGYRQGFYSAMGLTIALMVLFNWRYMASGKFMPGGMMAIVSALVLVALILGWVKGDLPKKKD